MNIDISKILEIVNMIMGLIKALLEKKEDVDGSLK